MKEEDVSLLDAYMGNLQSGIRPGKETLIAKNPQLAGALQCLELLERMAPPHPQPLSRQGRGEASEDERATVAALPARDTGAGQRLEIHLQSSDLGKYEVECELGRGGMGVVFKARQKDLGRPVALKMILSSHLASDEHLERFQDEAKAAAGLHHPNIVAIYEAGQINGQPFFAMQYVSGPSLAKRIRQGPLTPEEAARIVLAIARAVDHLHQNGIVHRDLKPSNILLDERGTPFVTDFGLVKMLSGDSHSRTSTGVIIGTPSYMAPEQAAAQKYKVSALSDIYSLGAILYELLTGRPPFAADSPLDTLVQVIESEPIPPRRLCPAVPRELETICLRVLEKNPADRYPSAAALADDLERFLKNEEIECPTPGIVNRLLRWTRREPALAARLVTLAICIGLAQISFQFFRTIPVSLHLHILGILALWGLLSAVCQRLMRTVNWSDDVRFLWAGLDVVLYTWVMVVDEALLSPIIIGFPLLVAASGLWFRVPLVWFTTAIAMASYLVLMLEWWVRTGALEGLHKHIMLLVGLAMLGFITSYQVNRVRALSRFYEQRPLP
ncbi:MAG: serine/threonine protein kinase [Gemmataceae bacterium]|nr:serine/threonine protein kinase [Gemmataceae bacterium]